uniref:Uncharacterized protein n=1 Tax=Schistocephalus solidus TaxID=70667 RepID=A0A0V0J2L0_SCHSO
MGLVQFLTAFETLKRDGSTKSVENLADALQDSQDLTETLCPSIYARINSFFSFALCSPSGVALRSLALQLISSLAENPLNRLILVARFSILVPLANGIRLWQGDQIRSEVLQAFFKCTIDLHQIYLVVNDDVLIAGARQTVKLLQKSNEDQFSEIALGTLANFCRIPTVTQKNFEG